MRAGVKRHCLTLPKGQETIQQDELSHESNDVMTGRTGSDAVADGVCFYVSE